MNMNYYFLSRHDRIKPYVSSSSQYMMYNIYIGERLFLDVPWGCLRFVIVVFPEHTHLPFFQETPCSSMTPAYVHV